MKIHFATPINTTILIISIICFSLICLYSIYKNKSKKRIISIILKFIFIILLVIALSSPTVNYKKTINIRKKILVILDSSQSMLDGTIINSNISNNISLAKKYIKIIKKYSSLPIELLYGTNYFKKLVGKNLLLENRAFNLQYAFDECTNPEFSSSFIITDANRNYTDETYNGNSPIYFLSQKIKRHDVYIKDANYNENILEVNMI